MQKLVVEISFHVHATESEDKVLRGVEGLGVKRGSLERRRTSGHYGNTILIFTGKLEGREAEFVLNNVIGRLEENSRISLAYRLEDFVDGKGRVHIRLDKQELIRGRAVIGSKDPIKLVFKTKGSRIVMDELKRMFTYGNLQ